MIFIFSMFILTLGGSIEVIEHFAQVFHGLSHDYDIVYESKFLHGPKPDPVWVYLEREMRENIHKKPYNERVGEWLKFLKRLKKYHHTEAKRIEKSILKDTGPNWYIELSNDQIDLLKQLQTLIRTDLIEDIPVRVRKAMLDFGVVTRFPTKTLMKAMHESAEDPGVFIWTLYTEMYKVNPLERRSDYDLDAMLLMSALVSIDLDETLEALEELTKSKPIDDVVKEEKKVKKTRANIPLFNEYLQRAPVIASIEKKQKEEHKAPPLDLKVRLRNVESYEKLRLNLRFLERRKKKYIKEHDSFDSGVGYSFWSAPIARVSTGRSTERLLENTDPNVAAYVAKLKQIKQRPKIKFKAPFENVQYNIGPVVFIGGKPRYLLNGVSCLNSGYIPINGGIRNVDGNMVRQIHGLWKFPRESKVNCTPECDCLDKWNEVVVEYLDKSKCRCGHRYDLHNKGKVKEKYFYPPTRYEKYWMDTAKIYQTDDREDFIRNAFDEAIMSNEPTPEPSEPTIIPAGLKSYDLLEALLSELQDTSLIIPHLPDANLLKALQEWVRNRINGPMTAAYKKKKLHRSVRRWTDMKNRGFACMPYRIPLSELQHYTWDSRKMIEKLYNILFSEYYTRNQKKLIYETQLWWATMTDHDPKTTRSFREIFFSYMPARRRDILIVNPFSYGVALERRKYHGNVCPLD